MELKFHYEVYKSDGTYCTEGTLTIPTTISNAYEMVAIGYLYNYPSRSQKIANLTKKAKSLTRKYMLEWYGLSCQQIKVDVEFLLEGDKEIHNNQFIDGFFKWYIKEVFVKNNDILYDEYGPAHFIQDAIYYFNKYYDGNLESWVWDYAKKYNKN